MDIRAFKYVLFTITAADAGDEVKCIVGYLPVPIPRRSYAYWMEYVLIRALGVYLGLEPYLDSEVRKIAY